MFKRELQGALVSPWMLFGRDSRIVTLFGQIYSSTDVEQITGESTPFGAEDTYGAMMLLAAEGKEPVKIIVNNRGGTMPAGNLIVSAIEHLQNQGIEVQILVIGSSMGTATWILSAGTPGKRYALKRSIIHLGKFQAAVAKTASMEDRDRTETLNDRFRETLHTLLAERTKLPEYHRRKMGEKEVHPDILKPEFRQKQIAALLGQATDLFFSPEEALELGLIDKIFYPGDPQIDEIFRVPAKHKEAGFGDIKGVQK